MFLLLRIHVHFHKIKVMKTITQIRLLEIEAEVTRLRSFVIGVAGKDREGNYQPKFVKDVLAASRDDVMGEFTTPETFLKTLKEQ